MAGEDRANTIVALLKVPASNALGNAGVIQGTASGTRVWSMLLDTFTPFGNSDFGNGGPDVSGDTWTVVAMSKGSGPEPYRWHVAPQATGVWTHQDDTSNVADGSGGTDQIQFGVAENTGGIVIAALACYSGELSDVEIEALGVTSMNDWLDGDPLAAWQLNQEATTDDVLDLTDGGADQTAITGTTVADDPDGWAYFSPAVAVAISPATTTSTAQTLARTKVRLLGTATTSGSPQPLDRAKTRVLGTVATTSTAQALGAGKSRTLGAAATAGTAQSLGRAKTRAIAVAATTSIALPLTNPDTAEPARGTITLPGHGQVTLPTVGGKPRLVTSQGVSLR